MGCRGQWAHGPGFNVAEAVNFAAPNWLPFGRNAVLCARAHGRTPPFSVGRPLQP